MSGWHSGDIWEAADPAAAGRGAGESDTAYKDENDKTQF